MVDYWYVVYLLWFRLDRVVWFDYGFDLFGWWFYFGCLGGGVLILWLLCAAGVCVSGVDLFGDWIGGFVGMLDWLVWFMLVFV